MQPGPERSFGFSQHRNPRWRLLIVPKSQAAGQAAFSGKFERFDGRAARAGRVAVGHYVDRNVHLLFALGGMAARISSINQR